MLAVAAPTTEEFKREFLEYLRDQRGVLLGYASPNDCYQALAHTVRRRLVQAWIATLEAQLVGRARFVFYLSAEYLLGRQLENALLHTGLGDTARRVLADLGLDLDALAAVEREPGLGNGGLGRLAACFLDSLATLGIPAVGYGIRYEFGIFRQVFVDGAQVEQPDEWLRLGCPWEFAHPELAEVVGLGGTTEHGLDSSGRLEVRWHPERTIVGVPYNILIPGYGGAVNTLRLWRARSPQEFNLQIFNDGDYTQAVQLDARLAAAFSKRGNAYLQKRDYDAALRDLTRAVELAPKEADYYQHLGDAYFYVGNLDQSIECYTQAMRLDWKRPIYYLRRSHVYSLKGDLKRADLDYRAAKMIDDGEVE